MREIDRGGHRAPGTFVHVNGLDVHVIVNGPEDGPAILLLAALGSNWFDLEPLTDQLRSRWRVIRYDRPGYGLSQPRPIGRIPTLSGEIDRINAVLACTGADHVVVLAHSMSSLYAEAYARAHPDRVDGLCMVEGSYVTLPWRLVPTRFRVINGYLATAALDWLGVTRLGGNRARDALLPSPATGFTDHERVWAPRVFGRRNMLLATLTENASFPRANLDLIRLRKRRPLPDVPKVVVATVSHMWLWSRLWVSKQRRYARMLDASFESLRGAKHFVVLQHPERIARIMDGSFRSP